MLVHGRVAPSIKFAGTHLYTWVERGTVRVKCFAQEHNTMSLARARTRTTQSSAQHVNHEATMPPIQAFHTDGNLAEAILCNCFSLKPVLCCCLVNVMLLTRRYTGRKSIIRMTV